MTDARRAIERVDRQESLEFLAKMIRFKSYSATPGESELARFMVDAMTPPGLDAFLQEVEPGRFNAIGRWRGTGGGRSLLFNGHLDTNPVTEGWTVDPWGGIYDDRFIYGIGVSNMKAGDAAHFLHRLRMEGIVCGPGGRYNTMPDERVDVPDYLDMIRIYMLAMLDVCEVA